MVFFQVALITSPSLTSVLWIEQLHHQHISHDLWRIAGGYWSFKATCCLHYILECCQHLYVWVLMFRTVSLKNVGTWRCPRQILHGQPLEGTHHRLRPAKDWTRKPLNCHSEGFWPAILVMKQRSIATTTRHPHEIVSWKRWLVIHCSPVTGDSKW